MSRGISSLGLYDLYPEDDLTPRTNERLTLYWLTWRSLRNASLITVDSFPIQAKVYGLSGAPVRRGRGNGVGEPFSIQAVPVVFEPLKQGLASNIFGLLTAFEPPRGVAWVMPMRTHSKKVRTRAD